MVIILVFLLQSSYFTFDDFSVGGYQMRFVSLLERHPLATCRPQALEVTTLDN